MTHSQNLEHFFRRIEKKVVKIDIKYIESIHPLGTTDGETYSVVVRR
jgi:hypothetical protein